MTNTTDYQQWIGTHAVDNAGEKIGKVGQIYLDDQTDTPAWITVSTGLFGSHESFAPAYGAATSDGNLRLAVSKDLVKSAPHIATDGHLDEQETDALYEHYQGYLGTGAGHDQHAGDVRHDVAGDVGAAGHRGAEGHDTSGPNTDDAMTRSEERLQVGTQRVESGRARLRKFIVTEQVTQSVPLRHEEAVISREPITDANRGAALAGGDLTEEEHEVVLHAEQPVVSKETVPVERVRLGTETVTGERQVSETLRKEQIDQVEVVTDDTTTRENRR